MLRAVILANEVVANPAQAGRTRRITVCTSLLHGIRHGKRVRSGSALRKRFGGAEFRFIQ